MTTTFGPYSPITHAGDLYFVAGQVGVHPETKIAPEDIGNQTERAILNLENVLKDVGLELSDVVKTTVFLTNMDDFAAMNDVYETRFSVPRPARSAVGVKELPRVGGDSKILIEVEAVAVKGHK